MFEGIWEGVGLAKCIVGEFLGMVGGLRLFERRSLGGYGYGYG